MGITGLWPILEPSCQPVTLESLEGKKLAVDVSIWIYQAQLGYSAETRSPHLALVISRLCKLLFYKIKPVFVFDGPNVPVFKKRVLEERRMKKFDDDILLNKGKRKHLEDLAKGSQSEEVVVKKLVSPTKKARREDDALFNLPSTSAEEIILSDDDEEEIIVEKVVSHGVISKPSEIERLIDLRENIRLSRLHPDSIPQDTETFCQFQLARVLGKNRIDRTIARLTKEHQESIAGNEVRLAVADSTGGTHVISYDNDVQVINTEETSAFEETWNSLGLTLEHFQPTTLQASPEKKNIDDFGEDLADIAGREFLGKTSMIEAFMKRRIGNDRANSIRQDSWSSSDSGDDDFIDVDDEVDWEQKTEETKESVEEVEKEWSPEDREEKEREEQFRVEFLAQRQREDDRDPGAYRDLQDFLTACGFPWIEAPGEAEAQCVELERLGLVQGVVSDDSDVWAFGAQNVYRHLFSKNKNVQHYSQKEILKNTNLTQANIVEIAMLSGGDYSSGIRGVGIVAAVELLAEFTQKQNNEKEEVNATMSSIERWLLSKPVVELTAVRRKLRNMVEKQNDAEYLQGISNPEIVDAYLSPNVDSSKEPLRWRRVDIDRIRALVRDQLGWTDEKFDKTTFSSFQRWNDFVSGAASYQKHITSYVLSQSEDEQKMAMTKRVADALARLGRKNNDDPLSLICQASFQDDGSAPGPSTRRPTTSTKSRGRGRRGAAAAQKKKKPAASSKKLDLSESSSDDD